METKSFIPVQDWFFTAATPLETSSSPHMAALDRIIRNAMQRDNQECHGLPRNSQTLLQAICINAQESGSIADECRTCLQSLPVFDVQDCLGSKAASAHVQERHVSNLKSLMASAQVWRLAGWGVTVLGNIVGMISVPGGGPKDEIMGETCRLVAVPPVRGIYKQGSDLSPFERLALDWGAGLCR